MASADQAPWEYPREVRWKIEHKSADGAWVVVAPHATHREAEDFLWPLWHTDPNWRVTETPIERSIT